MSCFFGCFRVKASHSHLTAPRKEIVVSRSRNALSSLFIHDDDSSKQGEQSRNQLGDHPDAEKHKNEDNFFKASGTLIETPTEFVKALEKLEDESIPRGEEKLISSLRVGKLNLEMRDEDSPANVKVCGGESFNVSGSIVVDSPSSCITDGHSIRRSSISSIQNNNIRDEISHTDVHDAEIQSETSSVMPDVYAINAHSALDPIEMSSDCRKAEDEASSFSNPGESCKLTEGILASTTESENGMKYGEQLRTEVNNSALVKPTSPTKGWVSKDFGESVCHRRIPSDRPILGMVAAHWNEDEVPKVPPKWWDGNGIPNSTNKYKEDQKVSWHAMSFEERLEKALSEESLISQMKHVNSASNVELDEAEDSDTAMSRLDSSAQSKSLISV